MLLPYRQEERYAYLSKMKRFRMTNAVMLCKDIIKKIES